MPDLKRAVLVGTAAVLVLVASPLAAQEQQKPNILVIFGDDIGMYNIGAYNRGMLGGSTSNIDRIAEEGALFTDYYAQQSCTAGRAAFISGQRTRSAPACSPSACRATNRACRTATRRSPSS